MDGRLFWFFELMLQCRFHQGAGVTGRESYTLILRVLTSLMSLGQRWLMRRPRESAGWSNMHASNLPFVASPLQDRFASPATSRLAVCLSVSVCPWCRVCLSVCLCVCLCDASWWPGTKEKTTCIKYNLWTVLKAKRCQYHRTAKCLLIQQPVLKRSNR